MTTKAERLAVAECGIRWANNILVEVLSNQGSVLPGEARKHLRAAVIALQDADLKMRFPDIVQNKPQ